MRQIAIDTETTGLDIENGHRVIEIGAVEMIDRRLTGNHFHFYLNPEREVEAGALAVHGITNDFLKDKPLFAEVAEPLLAFIKNAELIIHNAPFDTGFLNFELNRVNKKYPSLNDEWSIVDTLLVARKKHPGQRNSLDALCKRYNVDNSERKLHGALMDAELLARVYLAMTGGQATLFGDDMMNSRAANIAATSVAQTESFKNRMPLLVIKATAEEIASHEARMKEIAASVS